MELKNKIFLDLSGINQGRIFLSCTTCLPTELIFFCERDENEYDNHVNNQTHGGYSYDVLTFTGLQRLTGFSHDTVSVFFIAKCSRRSFLLSGTVIIIL